MNKVMSVLIFVGVVLAQAPLALSADADCPHCQLIASEAPWPEESVVGGRTLTFGMFQITIPDGWVRLSVLPEQTAVARYENGYRVALALETYDQVPLDGGRQSFEAAGYRMIDYPHLIFLGDPSTGESAVTEAARLEKRLRYEGMSNARVFKKDGFTAYVAEIRLGDHTVDASIVFEEQPDFVLRMLGSKMPASTVEAIIGSVQIREDN